MTTSSSQEQLTAERTVDASPSAVFALLADPSRHRETEPGEWVLDAVDPTPITRAGQVFGMNMYIEPVGRYVMHNEVVAFEQDRSIAWAPGQYDDEGHLDAGGWLWRYDLVPAGDGTRVRLTYDWSATPQAVRDEFGGLPPFGADFLEQSLESLVSALARPRDGGSTATS